jgi:glycosyltransferase involved in cell wall biosynthesis
MADLKKNILIVIPSLTLGGAEKQALNYALSIAGINKYNPVIIGLGREGELIPFLNQYNIKHSSFLSPFITQGNRYTKMLFFVKLVFFIKKHKPYKIISFTYWPNLLMGVIWRFTGANSFYWNQRSVDSSIQISILEKIAIKLKPKYIANSKACADFISQRHKINLKEIKIIYNVLEMPVLSTFKTNEPPLKFVMIANFFPEKDYSTLLKAFSAYIVGNNSLAELHIIGSAPGVSSQMEIVKAEAFDLGLCGKVFFHGTMSNPNDVLKIADIAILSTRSEGFSNTIIEYMAYGLPVIATDIPSNREALGDENQAFLFPIGDVGKLKTLLVTLAQNKELRENIGKKNRIIALEMFNKNRFNNSLLQLLN